MLAAFKTALSIGVPLHVFTPAQSADVRDVIVSAARFV